MASRFSLNNFFHFLEQISFSPVEMDRTIVSKITVSLLFFRVCSLCRVPWTGPRLSPCSQFFNFQWKEEIHQHLLYRKVLVYSCPDNQELSPRYLNYQYISFVKMLCSFNSSGFVRMEPMAVLQMHHCSGFYFYRGLRSCNNCLGTNSVGSISHSEKGAGISLV